MSFFKAYALETDIWRSDGYTGLSRTSKRAQVMGLEIPALIEPKMLAPSFIASFAVPVSVHVVLKLGKQLGFFPNLINIQRHSRTEWCLLTHVVPVFAP